MGDQAILSEQRHQQQKPRWLREILLQRHVPDLSSWHQTGSLLKKVLAGFRSS